jgi:3,4-dihydroxy 2-butanone 4-phosphate synthase
VRTGHTEAAVDFCNLAGLQPVGVICELVESGEEVEGMAVMAGDVGMMRRDGCLAFGKKWGLKVCTIEDLVKYRERTEGPLDDSLLNGENVDGETLNGEVKSVV